MEKNKYNYLKSNGTFGTGCAQWKTNTLTLFRELEVDLNFSIIKVDTVLLRTVNAKYQFVLADFGTNGISGDGVLQNTKFFEMLNKGELHIPSEEPVKEMGTNLPYFFVADDAFVFEIYSLLQLM